MPLALSMRVTRDPNRANDWAISTPIGPAPITARRRGSSVSVNTFSLVSAPAFFRPGTGGTAARVPVATQAFENRSSAPPTTTVLSPEKVAWPR